MSADSLPFAAVVPEAARPDDFEAVRALLAAAALPAEDLTPAHLAHFLVIRNDDALVGAVGVEVLGPHGLLRSLVVDPAYRGLGHGVALVRAVEAHARSAGVGTLYLLTTTAEAFFRRLGYETADRAAAPEAVRGTAEFGLLCPDTAACMRRTLRPSAR